MSPCRLLLTTFTSVISVLSSAAASASVVPGRIENTSDSIKLSPLPYPAPPSSPCTDYSLISARGILEPQGPSIAFPSVINQTLAALPNGTTIDVTYPATASILDTAQGTEWVVRYLKQARANCPQQHFALLGFSQGALLHTMAATQLLDPNDPSGLPITEAIKAFLFMGNPLRSPNRSGNIDERGGKSNAGASGETHLDYPNLFDNYDRKGVVLDICYSGDPICEETGKGGLNAHRKYGSDAVVQDIGAKFLISRLQASGTSELSFHKFSHEVPQKRPFE